MLVPTSRLADAERIAADEVETKFQPKDPFADGAMLGPLSSAAQVERVTGYIQKGIDEGAKLVTGGPEPSARASSAATTSSRPCSPTCATT